MYIRHSRRGKIPHDIRASRQCAQSAIFVITRLGLCEYYRAARSCLPDARCNWSGSSELERSRFSELERCLPLLGAAGPWGASILPGAGIPMKQALKRCSAFVAQLRGFSVMFGQMVRIGSGTGRRSASGDTEHKAKRGKCLFIGAISESLRIGRHAIEIRGESPVGDHRAPAASGAEDEVAVICKNVKIGYAHEIDIGSCKGTNRRLKARHQLIDIPLVAGLSQPGHFRVESSQCLLTACCEYGEAPRPLNDGILLQLRESDPIPAKERGMTHVFLHLSPQAPA